MRLLLLIVSMVLCIAGGGLALLEYAKQPVYELDSRLNQNQAATETALLQPIDVLQRVSFWGWKDAWLLKAAATAEYTLAHDAGIYSDTGDALLSASLEDLSSGLAHAPADPAGWLHLAYLRVFTGAPASDITKALRMSIMTGPVIGQLMAPRLKLALTYWDEVPEGDKALYLQQMSMLSRVQPQEAQHMKSADERVKKLFDEALERYPQGMKHSLLTN